MSDIGRELAGMSRPEAIALFWRLAAQIAKQIRELKLLQQGINRRWGRAPRLPQW